VNAPLSYYVWYRIVGDAATARAAVTSMMLDVAAECGVAGQLMMRAEDPRTWMEIYDEVDDVPAFEQALARACEEHGVTALADEGRHIERFARCCAMDAEP
jgi:hypothetical protein